MFKSFTVKPQTDSNTEYPPLSWQVVLASDAKELKCTGEELINEVSTYWPLKSMMKEFDLSCDLIFWLLARADWTEWVGSDRYQRKISCRILDPHFSCDRLARARGRKIMKQTLLSAAHHDKSSEFQVSDQLTFLEAMIIWARTHSYTSS